MHEPTPTTEDAGAGPRDRSGSQVVVVGASVAGLAAARTLRAGGFEGTITVLDAQRHRPYDKPPLTKQVLRGEWDADRIALPDGAEDSGLELDLRLGVRAAALDSSSRTLTLDDGERLQVDGIVLACGAVPRQLPATEGIAGVHVIRTLDDAVAVRDAIAAGVDRVVVIGAGFIGGEVAASCRDLGAAVTMVEAADAPLERILGARVGHVVADLHRAHGVDVRLGVGVDGLEADGDRSVRAVRLADGSVVPASLVVVGIGVQPDVAWLDGSGLTVDDGVVCDDRLLAAPGIVASGDVARWPSARAGSLTRIEHWEHAIASGEAAAKRLLVDLVGADDPGHFDPVPWFWSDQYDRKLQLVGTAGADHELEVVDGSLDGPADQLRFAALYGLAGRVTGVLAMNHPARLVRLRQLVVDGADFASAVEEARR